VKINRRQCSLPDGSIYSKIRDDELFPREASNTADDFKDGSSKMNITQVNIASTKVSGSVHLAEKAFM
jgi:hypothetical protein